MVLNCCSYPLQQTLLSCYPTAGQHWSSGNVVTVSLFAVDSGQIQHQFKSDCLVIHLHLDLNTGLFCFLNKGVYFGNNFFIYLKMHNCKKLPFEIHFFISTTKFYVARKWPDFSRYSYLSWASLEAMAPRKAAVEPERFRLNPGKC